MKRSFETEGGIKVTQDGDQLILEEMGVLFGCERRLIRVDVNDIDDLISALSAAKPEQNGRYSR